MKYRWEDFFSISDPLYPLRSDGFRSGVDAAVFVDATALGAHRSDGGNARCRRFFPQNSEGSEPPATHAGHGDNPAGSMSSSQRKTTFYIHRCNQKDLDGSRRGRTPPDGPAGASLFDLYPEMGLRHLSDLDLLIDPRQSKAIGRVLTDLGYRTPDSVYPYLFEKGAVRIDLHMHPLNLDRIRRRRLLFPEAVGALWHRSARVEEENGALRVPDPFDNIVLLCAHAMKHGYGLLIWLVDLRELLNRLRHRPDGWQTIRRRALEWRQTRSVGYGLRLALALNDEDGSTVMEEQGFPPLGRLENRLLEMKRCGWHSKLLGLWLGGLSLEHRVNTLPLIWESAFPNPAVMEQIRRDKGDQWGALRRAVSGLCCAGEDLSAFFSSRFR
jgi:hypothetical protein